MAARRNIGVTHGLQPGSRDNPHHDPQGRRTLEAEARQRQDVADREARRRNPAYGTLNLTDWSERRAAGQTVVPSPGRQRRKR